MRKIDTVILHCSDSDSPKHDSIKIIDDWHKERGWKSPSGVHVGYHYFINQSGIIQHGRPEEEVGSHCKGHNASSIGICLAGRFIFQQRQFTALRQLIHQIRTDHGDVLIVGHKKFNENKTCPNFSVPALLKSLPPFKGAEVKKEEKAPEKAPEASKEKKETKSKPAQIKAEKKTMTPPKKTTPKKDLKA